MKFLLLFVGCISFAFASKKRGRDDNYALESFLEVFGDVERPEKEDLALFFFELSTSEAKSDYKTTIAGIQEPEQISREFENCISARNFKGLESMIDLGKIPQIISDSPIEALVQSSTQESLFILKLLLQHVPYVADFIPRSVARLAAFVAEEHGPCCLVVLDWLDVVSPEYSWKSQKKILELVMRELIVNFETDYCNRLFSGINEGLDFICDIVDVMLASMDACMLWKPILETWNAFTSLGSNSFSSIAPDSLFIVLKAAYAESDFHVTSLILHRCSPVVVNFLDLPFAQLGHLGRNEDLITLYSEVWITFGELDHFVILLEAIEFSS